MNTLVFQSENNQKKVSSVGKSVVMILTGWFLLVLAVALTGNFNVVKGAQPLPTLFAVLMPVGLFGLAYFSLASFKAWVLALDIRHLILLHSWRMVGMGFVFLYFQNKLPALFALPAGLGDAMAAMGALFLGIALYDQAEKISKNKIFMWNTFGLIDFVIAISMGLMTRVGEPFHFSGQVGSDIMSTFPLVLIPGFAVPFYVIVHLIIYAKLRA